MKRLTKYEKETILLTHLHVQRRTEAETGGFRTEVSRTGTSG